MIINDLKKIYLENRDKNPIFLRSLFKERLQLYALDFVNKSAWNDKLIFKGGTALRICFDLPRLSEDLDFDIPKNEKFNMKDFEEEVKNYFIKNWQFKDFFTKIAHNERTIYVKFPILKQIGLPIQKAESDVLHLRLDFADVSGVSYKTEISVKTTSHFSFFVRRYSLPDLFAGKIAAILQRERTVGKIKEARYKGRDYFDLIWFLEKNVKPNWQFLKEMTKLSKTQVISEINEKVKHVDQTLLKQDLMPFMEDGRFVSQFAVNYQRVYQGLREKL